VLLKAKKLPVEQYALVVDYYQGILRDTYSNHESRKADLDYLRPVIGRYRSLDSLLTDLTLDPIEGKREAKPGPVEEAIAPLTLSTIHSAKGLEWRHVYLIGTSDGTLPSYRALAKVDATGSGEEIEEEKRLLYVAVTRAMRELDICFTHQASQRGTVTLQELSRFLSAEEVKGTLERVDHGHKAPFTERDILAALMGLEE
jgi:DNA helicase-2/ATP-dependent DNA helicase PcrA